MTSLSFDFQPDVRPLAARLRPLKLADYVGQQHLLGPGTPLKRAIESGKVTSLILWGPPGTGKTTLAELIAAHADAPASADLARVASRLPHAFANLASAALSEALTAAARGEAPQRSEIQLRYPSPPRGVDGRGV